MTETINCINEFSELYELLEDSSSYLLLLKEIVANYFSVSNEFILFFLLKFSSLDLSHQELLVYASLFTLWIEKRNCRMESGKLVYYYCSHSDEVVSALLEHLNILLLKICNF
jgi:hypothetical protein